MNNSSKYLDSKKSYLTMINKMRGGECEFCQINRDALQKFTLEIEQLHTSKNNEIQKIELEVNQIVDPHMDKLKLKARVLEGKYDKLLSKIEEVDNLRSRHVHGVQKMMRLVDHVLDKEMEAINFTEINRQSARQSGGAFCGLCQVIYYEAHAQAGRLEQHKATLAQEIESKRIKGRNYIMENQAIYDKKMYEYEQQNKILDEAIKYYTDKIKLLRDKINYLDPLTDSVIETIRAFTEKLVRTVETEINMSNSVDAELLLRETAYRNEKDLIIPERKSKQLDPNYLHKHITRVKQVVQKYIQDKREAVGERPMDEYESPPSAATASDATASAATASDATASAATASDATASAATASSRLAAPGTNAAAASVAAPRPTVVPTSSRSAAPGTNTAPPRPSVAAAASAATPEQRRGSRDDTPEQRRGPRDDTPEHDDHDEFGYYGHDDDYDE
jgi:hypothetical protein